MSLCVGLYGWCSARENKIECWLIGKQDFFEEVFLPSCLCPGLLIWCVVTQEMSYEEWRQTHDEAFLSPDVHSSFLFSFHYFLAPYPPQTSSLVNRSWVSSLLKATQIRPEAI